MNLETGEIKMFAEKELASLGDEWVSIDEAKITKAQKDRHVHDENCTHSCQGAKVSLNDNRSELGRQRVEASKKLKEKRRNKKKAAKKARRKNRK